MCSGRIYPKAVYLKDIDCGVLGGGGDPRRTREGPFLPNF